MKRRTRIRVIQDQAGDLPPSIIGRYGWIVGRNTQHDEPEAKAYYVLIDGYKSNKVLWEDEIVRLRTE